MDLTPTPSQTVGPYLHLGLTDARSISCVAGDEAKGERVWITFRVLDGGGIPVPDAMIELWQADSEGDYVPENGGADGSAFRGFGRLATTEDGSCTFETIRPGCVPGPGETVSARHVVGPARSGSPRQLDFRCPPSRRGRDGIFRCLIMMFNHFEWNGKSESKQPAMRSPA
jgi:Dioxygenase